MSKPTKWVCAQQRLRSAWAFAQSDQSIGLRSVGSWGPKLSSCGQRRLWSDWVDAQADPSLCWAHSHFVGFVMSRLNYQIPLSITSIASDTITTLWIGTAKWAMSWENLFLPYANNKGADQPAHLRSLISTFVVRCLDNIIPLASISKISSLHLASVAERVGLSLPWSQTLKTGFLVTSLQYEPRREKTCLWSLRPGKNQTGLLSYWS